MPETDELGGRAGDAGPQPVTDRPVTTVEPLGLPGVFLLHGVRHTDERGFLRKVVVSDVLREAGLDLVVDEVVSTTNEAAGTVRGLHYQAAPHEETKTLWVTSCSTGRRVRGRRRINPTYGQHSRCG